MNCSDMLKYVINFSALALVVNTTFSAPVQAEEAWLRACSNAKTAENCQLPFQQGLAPVLTGAASDARGQWGYITTNGRMAIQPAFSEAHGFVNDLAAVKKGEQFGYIDKKGEWEIPPRFTRASDFNAQGTALVVIDNRLALIDRKGAVIKTLPFAASLNSQGFVKGQPLASVQTEVSPAVWNASAGRSLALPDDIMAVGTPQSGLIPAQERDTAKSGYWGYLNDHGEWVIEPSKLKTRIKPVINDNVVAVSSKNGWAFFDRLGTALSNEQYKSVRPLSSGSWLVIDGNNILQLLTNKLEKIQDLPIDKIDDFRVLGDLLVASSGKDVVMIGKDNQVNIIKANKPQILQQGERLWIMQPEGKSAQLVQIYDKNGVGLLSDATLVALRDFQLRPINAKEWGKDNAAIVTDSNASSSLPLALLIPNDSNQSPSILTVQGGIFSDPQWSSFAENTSQSALLVHTKNKMVGVIDGNGQWIIQPAFKRIDSFEGDYSWAVVSDENGTDSRKLIDRTGNVIEIPADILSITQGISANMLLIAEGENKNKRWGLWDIHSKKFKIEPRFIQLEPADNGYAVVKSDEGWGVVNADGQWAIAPDVARTGKPQAAGGGLFTVAADNNRYSLFSVKNGQAIASDLLQKPQHVGAGNWLVHPADGSITLIDDGGRAVVSKAILPSSTEIDGNWVLLSFDSRFGAINSHGDWQVEPRYSKELNFIAPLNWMNNVSDGRPVLINDHGVEAIPDMVNALPLASMIRVAMNDEESRETVLYDNSGREVQRYSGLNSILVAYASEGVVPLRDSKSGLFSLIAANGKRLIGAYFNSVGPMVNYRAKAVKQQQYGANIGFINPTGRFIIAPKFTWADNFSESRAWVGLKSQTQLINTDGAVQATLLTRCNQRIIINGKNKQIWPAKLVKCSRS